MAIMLIKNRTRKPLAIAVPNSIGIAPNGVGGMDAKMVVIISVGDYRILIPTTDLARINAEVETLKQSAV